MSESGIYVERTIHAPLDKVWAHTQTPDLHQRWDLRFTRIEYLQRPSPDEPQRFLYMTRLLGPLAIRGTGESVGQRHLPNGEATSALHFGSDQPWSLIRSGSGYWQYIPTDGGLRFLTWYDYTVRFGVLGRLTDRLVLRPAMGWATAWSFDRLRLWVEDGQSPELSLALALAYTIARSTVAFVWLWHGIVPKLWFHDPAERLMVAQASLPPQAVTAAGWAEIAFSLLMLVAWRWRPLFLVNIALMLAALAGVALRSPQFLTHAFNPVTLNLCVIALSGIGYLIANRVPSASTCLRKKLKEAE